jgi:hypothetical protein
MASEMAWLNENIQRNVWLNRVAWLAGGAANRISGVISMAI